MRAIVWTQYGPPDVLQPQEVEKPVSKENGVLIRIRATTVTAGDCEIQSLQSPICRSLLMRLWRGLIKPKGTTIPGMELAGETEAVGQEVTLLKKGDQVLGAAGVDFGAAAEYICLPEKPGEMEEGVAIKPANMTFEEAAAVPFGGRDDCTF